VQRGRHLLPPLDLSAGPTLENKRFILGFLASLSNPELFSREQLKISTLEEYFRGINRNQRDISSAFQNRFIPTIHLGNIPLLNSNEARPDIFRQAVIETSEEKYNGCNFRTYDNWSNRAFFKKARHLYFHFLYQSIHLR